MLVLPAALSLALGAAVIGAALEEPGRSLDILGTGADREVPLTSDDIAILGLSSSYGVSEAIILQVAVADGSFDCGDLYVTISRAGTGEVVSHDGYFGQCYAATGAALPVEGSYVKSLDTRGDYEVKVDLNDVRGAKSASVRGEFSVQ